MLRIHLSKNQLKSSSAKMAMVMRASQVEAEEKTCVETRWAVYDWLSIGFDFLTVWHLEA